METKYNIMKFKESDYTKEQIQTMFFNATQSCRDTYIRRCNSLPIYFMSFEFEAVSDAESFLNVVCKENNRPIAVRVTQYEPQPVGKYVKLREQFNACRRKVCDLNRLYYAGKPIKMLQCPVCGTALSTADCGTLWFNSCPLCGAELRPASVMVELSRCENKINTLRCEMCTMWQNHEVEMKEMPVVYWYIAYYDDCKNLDL